MLGFSNMMLNNPMHPDKKKMLIKKQKKTKNKEDEQLNLFLYIKSCLQYMIINTIKSTIHYLRNMWVNKNMHVKRTQVTQGKYNM